MYTYIGTMNGMALCCSSSLLQKGKLYFPVEWWQPIHSYTVPSHHPRHRQGAAAAAVI